MASYSCKYLPLFGSCLSWRKEDWTNSDDTVRGGTSYSKLLVSSEYNSVTFAGKLDCKLLGAAFASQRTTSTTQKWDLCEYDGIKITLRAGDGKMYTLNIKTDIPPHTPDGRDQSSLQYSFDFIADDSKEEQVIYALFERFIPSYRGRKQEGAPPLNRANIRRWSIMIRSFFGKQEGDFCLVLDNLSAFEKRKSNQDRPCGLCLLQ
ncbi:hypothetical protein NEOLI_005258 [Neolecta irregularis DAH-3]|uniref:NADH:ubiquinone oxidoreductase intermediate-associated protein 30 domain-containing protein n=1 Tax=Neolecta irregularis (strain DAH-3) TaxID=1198029 RepID=A0A1U7LMH0_NEOID|nr:hypothetical protein NEOLI_005258 [Neolecta irregularis DAH-3]|eukprot:OLL23828.1 hypothetical protein NEOLI_005258 [Neolecta irregularis DAH-3]